LYGQKPPTPFEQALLRYPKFRGLGMESEEARGVATIQAIYREAQQRSSVMDNFTFLGKLFDITPEPLYVDYVHLGPKGNQIVANRLAEEIVGATPAKGGAYGPWHSRKASLQPHLNCCGVGALSSR